MFEDDEVLKRLYAQLTVMRKRRDEMCKRRDETRKRREEAHKRRPFFL